jgi:hypothetical protein
LSSGMAIVGEGLGEVDGVSLFAGEEVWTEDGGEVDDDVMADVVPD